MEGELQGEEEPLSNQIGHVVGRANGRKVEVTVGSKPPTVVTVLNEEWVVETVGHGTFESWGRGLAQCR